MYQLKGLQVSLTTDASNPRLVTVEGIGHEGAAYRGDFFGMGVSVNAMVGIEGEVHENIRMVEFCGHA